MPRFATARAKAGAALLDILRPGWADKINLDTLDLKSCQVCVLGQLYGSYEKGATALFAMQVPVGTVPSSSHPRVWDSAARAGFVSVGQNAESVPLVRYTTLTAAWKREIEKRQAA